MVGERFPRGRKQREYTHDDEDYRNDLFQYHIKIPPKFCCSQYIAFICRCQQFCENDCLNSRFNVEYRGEDHRDAGIETSGSGGYTIEFVRNTHDKDSLYAQLLCNLLLIRCG